MTERPPWLALLRGTALGGRSLAAFLVLCLALIWLAYQLGQLRAGYNRSAAFDERRVLADQLAAARERNARLEEQIVRQETEASIRSEAYRQVEARLAELQATVIAQQEDLAFFRGLVSEPGDGEGPRIQNVVIAVGLAPDSYTVQVVLSQPMGQQQRVSGHLELDVEGTLGERLAVLGLAELSLDESGPERLGFAFRYFQNLEADLRLPDGFLPARLVVRLIPDARGAESREQRFEWRVGTG
ncbi:MAG: hypothetical protein JJT85_05365 [Chromatiales bacterium]|nr:hypothetical protein [Chromatiales bacterium]